MVWYCTKHEKHSIDDMCPDCGREPTIAGLQAKIERLRAFLERGGIDSSAVLAGEDDGTWQDENERLRAQLEGRLDFKGALTDTVAKQQERIEKLERVRDAVQEIAKQNLPDEMEDPDCGDYMGGYEALVLVAREALAACDKERE
jgi:hypothetical protein